jgi:hypothetical protein
MMMSFAAITQEIRSQLLRIDERLLEIEAQLAAGTPRDKVEAAGELAFLKQQKQDLEQRLARLQTLPEGTWSTIREWLREEATMLERRLEGWIAQQ